MKRRCEDCDSIDISGIVSSGGGDGLCSECHGTGLDKYAEALTLGLEGTYPCKVCSGTKQCQSCGGTGFEYFNDGAEDSNEDFEDNTSSYESSGSAYSGGGGGGYESGSSYSSGSTYRVPSASSTESSTPWTGIIILLLLGGGVAFYYFRGSEKKKPVVTTQQRVIVPQQNNTVQVIPPPAINTKYHRELQPIEQIGFSIKIYDYQYGNERFLQNFLNWFQQKYANEFELRNKMQVAEKEISSLVNSLKFTTIYMFEKEVEFGEYNFDKGEFDFRPFSVYHDVRDVKLSQVIFKRYNFFSHAGINSADNRTSDIYILNFEEFDGLPVNKSDAEKLITLKTTYYYERARVDRHLYLRIYYSILDKKFQQNNGMHVYDSGLFCFVYKVEVWADKNMQNNLVAVLNAKTSVPEYLTDTKRQFDQDYIYPK